MMESNQNNGKLKIFHDCLFSRTIAQKCNNVPGYIELLAKKTQLHKTNNTIEGWNSTLNKKISRPRPTF